MIATIVVFLKQGRGEMRRFIFMLPRLPSSMKHRPLLVWWGRNNCSGVSTQKDIEAQRAANSCKCSTKRQITCGRRGWDGQTHNTMLPNIHRHTEATTSHALQTICTSNQQQQQLQHARNPTEAENASRFHLVPSTDENHSVVFAALHSLFDCFLAPSLYIYSVYTIFNLGLPSTVSVYRRIRVIWNIFNKFVFML